LVQEAQRMVLHHRGLRIHRFLDLKSQTQ
jgi:hypothetical protein